MKARIDTKNKSSAKKKLIPAAGSLLISAAMLSTSTYAWFTMSREVEVKNIKMTATVPEDIQISLGHLVGFAGNDAGDAVQANVQNYEGLAKNEGKLKAAGDGTADNGAVMAPYENNDAISMLDWANSADISEYYKLGKIMPASSTDGKNIYFTPDASGVGKTIKADALYYTAANGLVAQNEDRTVEEGQTVGKYNTTLHAINNTTRASDVWQTDGSSGDTYQTATDWNDTNDDGYYVDIPVWIRTSSTEGAKLAVDAYVTTNKEVDEDDLYWAARAVILYDGTEDTVDVNDAGTVHDVTAAGKTVATTGLVEVRKDNWEGTSIVDFMSTTNSNGEAVKTVSSNEATYGSDNHYAGAKFLTLDKGTGTGYGKATKAIVRVWLEGEDPNCWNQNAGQNFNISLKFTKEAVTSAEKIAFTDNANNTTTSLVRGTTTQVKVMDGETLKDTLTFEYNGTVWKQTTTAGSFHPTTGYTYTINSNTVTTSDEIATQLNSLITTKAQAEAGATVNGSTGG